ncbi:MAG: ATP-binding protein [Syntrophobacteraceae bacterium]
MLQLRKKISHRFFLAIMLVAVIPIGIMGYGSFVLTKKTLTGFAFLHIGTTVENRANHLESWLDERLNDIGVLSRLPAIREVCERYCREGEDSFDKVADQLGDTLNLIEGRSPSYENIYVLLPDGRIFASTHPETADSQSVYGLEMIGRSWEGSGPVLGSVYQHPGKEGWHVQFAYKILGRDGNPIAFLMAVLDLSKTIDPIMVERVGLGETGETYLVNKDRRIISESRFLDWPELIDQSFHTVGIEAVLDEKKGTSIYDNYMGEEVLGSYMWLPRFEWGILAEMHTDEILWTLQWIKTIAILSAVLVGIICLSLAYTVSRRVSRPIVQVADAAQRMAEGELKQRIPFASTDEVGRLAGSFNVMAEKLAQSVTSLQQKEKSLQEAYDNLLATQEQLLRYERMAAVGELVASVAHEMRSPLSSIKLNLQIIGRSLGRETVLFEHFEIANDQVGQLERMFSDLLNYSKPLDIQRKEVPVETLIDKTLQELEGELSARSIAVERHIEPNLPCIIGDPGKIEQVMVNVVKNALEASDNGGKIEISAKAEESSSSAVISILVTDHGCGISERNLKAVYKPFFTTKKKGTGLGLAIVKKIVDAHQGQIAIASEQGRGTTVHLKLLCARGNE